MEILHIELDGQFKYALAGGKSAVRAFTEMEYTMALHSLKLRNN